MAKWTINNWNAKVDRTLTVRRLGRQGILYEYELPYGADPMLYYEDAINVKSIKRSEQYNNGKRPGQYQPIGDKRYFNYYQLNKMSAKQKQEWMQELYMQTLLKEFINEIEEEY
jgi:hypothetical protein